MEVLSFQLVAPPRSSYPDSSQKMLRPVAAVERPVLDGFGDVRGADGLGALEVGDGARDFQNAVVGAGAQTQAGHGVFEQAFALGRNIAIFADLSRAHLGVAVDLFTLVALELAAPGRHHALADLFRDRKSTRLNSSHPSISYAVFCLKKKKRKPATDSEPSSQPPSRTRNKTAV